MGGNFENDSHTSAFLIIHEIVFVLFCVIGICIDITIINTVYGFNRMRTVPNTFLANWALADIFSLLITPTAYNIIPGLSRLVGFLPFLVRMGVIMHTTEILCVATVSIDWFLSGCSTRASTCFRKLYKYIIVSAWLFAAITILTALTVCRWYCSMEGIELVICYLGLAALILIAQIWRGISKCRRRPLEPPGLFINLATIFLLTWAFGTYNIAVLPWVGKHPLVAIIFDCLTFSTPIINVALLYYFNQDFQACFIQIFTRSSHKYTQEALDLPENDLENQSSTTATINNTNNLS